MKTLIIAAAALGLSAAGAYAACSDKHMTQAATDQITTASVATPQTTKPASEEAQAEPILIPEEK